MFRRLISGLLIAALVAGTPALAEGVSAGELLFGSMAAVPATVDPDAPTMDPDATNPADGLHADVYGANDQASIDAYQVLQLGDRDQDDGAAYIVMLQNRLIQLGFLQSAADGVFGKATETAVLQFQKLNGLAETGIADAATQHVLFSDVSALATPSPDNPVVYGSVEERVQTKLTTWGFMVGRVDGKLGDGTRKAIEAFKNYVIMVQPQAPTPSPEPTPEPTPVPTPAPGELPMIQDELLPAPTLSPEERVNGNVDEELLSYVDEERPFEIFVCEVKNGDQHEEVKRVQTRLKQLKYLYPEADGKFGNSTELALKYFQRKSGLPETGIADEATQRALFSLEAPRAEEYVFPYKAVVDISDQRVYIYGWDGQAYSQKVKKMICSTGKDKTPTPLGTYQGYGRMSEEWYYFDEFDCYARWAYGIVGGILFHSVTYSKDKVLNKGSVNNLGRKASHGCIRLEVEDAQWIYDNCPSGTTVVIQE